jgi:hypothetical protein
MLGSAQDACFVSPGVTFVKPWTLQELRFESALEPQLYWCYVGVFANGFRENAPSGISFDAFTIHFLEGEGVLLPLFESFSENDVLTGDITWAAGGTTQAARSKMPECIVGMNDNSPRTNAVIC